MERDHPALTVGRTWSTSTDCATAELLDPASVSLVMHLRPRTPAYTESCACGVRILRGSVALMGGHRYLQCVATSWQSVFDDALHRASVVAVRTAVAEHLGRVPTAVRAQRCAPGRQYLLSQREHPDHPRTEPQWSRQRHAAGAC